MPAEDEAFRSSDRTLRFRSCKDTVKYGEEEIFMVLTRVKLYTRPSSIMSEMETRTY